MSDQTIEITPFNVADYYVYYCKQNKIKVNESKIDNCIDRMQQPLISDSLKAEFRNMIMEQAISYGKAGIANSLKWNNYPKNGFDFFLVKSLTKFTKSII